MMTWQVVCLGIAIVAAVNAQQRICMHLEAAESTGRNIQERATLRGMPGKKGIKGDVGSPGIAVKGDPGEVDYDRIFSKMDQKFLEFLRMVDSNMGILETQIEANLFLEILKTRIPHADCQVFYENRCFRAVIHSTQDVNFETSRSLCNRTGEHPANIYSRNHMTLIMSLLRENIPSGNRWIFSWTGMQYNRQTNSVFLHDGSEAPYVKWVYPGPSHNRINLRINRHSSASSQGFNTHTADTRFDGVVCEW